MRPVFGSGVPPPSSSARIFGASSGESWAYSISLAGLRAGSSAQGQLASPPRDTLRRRVFEGYPGTRAGAARGRGIVFRAFWGAYGTFAWMYAATDRDPRAACLSTTREVGSRRQT